MIELDPVKAEIIKLLKNSGSIVLFPHISPDGDCLGASLGLALTLHQLGKEPVIYVEEKLQELSDKYRFLPGFQLIRSYSDEFGEEGQGDSTGERSGWSVRYDLAVALDTADEKRMGSRLKIFNMAGKRVNIDHHITNTRYGELNLIEDSSSVSEMIYRLVKEMNLPLSKDIAVCLYTGISSDTGGFRYSNTTSETHRLVAELIDYDIDVADISDRLFANTSLGKIRLTCSVLSNLKLHFNGLLAEAFVTSKMLSDTDTHDEDAEGIVSLIRGIRGVEVAVLFKEKEPCVTKVSLRSSRDVDVAEIARELGGGGHSRAAGCTLEMSVDDARKLVISKVGAALEGMGSGTISKI